MRPLKIASRPSQLALIQTQFIKDALQKQYPELDISIVSIASQGDKDKSEYLYQSEHRGLFTSEVERALMDGRADIAVHSLKDLPTSDVPELTIAAVPPREDPADALVTNKKVTGLADLPNGALIGTSSLRRIAQIKHIRKDLNCVPLRGNVETRVAKVTSGEIDAAVMACAGLNRLGLSHCISATLPLDDYLPAPAQGALAVQVRKDDQDLIQLISALDDPDTRLTVETERLVLATLHGGCSIPVGVYAYLKDNHIAMDAMICDLNGQTYIRQSRVVNRKRARDAALELAQALLNAGGEHILHQIRDAM